MLNISFLKLNYSLELLMKYLLIISCLLFSLIGCSEIINSDDLVLSKNDGLFYEKSKNKPFTGEVTGIVKGKIIKGKREGEWLEYYRNGSLESKSNFKDGKEEGELFWYYQNGKLEIKGNYKGGKEEGEFLSYDVNGRIVYKYNYKEGELDGEWLHYYGNGELKEKRIYKGGKIIKM